MKWFKSLDRWTDRNPVTALLLIGVICLLAGTITLEWRQDIGMTVSHAYLIVGFLIGIVFASLLRVIEILRGGK